MKSRFTLKIADLLNGFGSDEIELNEDGTTGNIELDALDGKSILVKVKNFEKLVPSICDKCGRTFNRYVSVGEYVAKYTLDKAELEESSEDVVMMIDAKNDTIDIAELLYQVQHSDDPFVISCYECENHHCEKNEEIDDEDETISIAR